MTVPPDQPEFAADAQEMGFISVTPPGVQGANCQLSRDRNQAPV